jgi:hypothetical protein
MTTTGGRDDQFSDRNGVGSPTVSTVEHVMTQAQTALHDGRANFL